MYEQDYSQLILDPTPRILARETGANTYTSLRQFNIRIAEDYWQETRAYWAGVRAEWGQLLDQSRALTVQTKSDAGRRDRRLWGLPTTSELGDRS